MSERADTAYSPRVREEEHSAAVSQIIIFPDPIDRRELVLVNFATSNKIRSGKVPFKVPLK